MWFDRLTRVADPAGVPSRTGKIFARVSVGETSPRSIAIANRWPVKVFVTKPISYGGFVSQPTALAELKRCFNCSFPLGGAAATFPAVGHVWNLVGPGGVAAPVKITTANATTGQWTFTAQPGHFDAAGSTISFAINQGRDNEFVLAVSADIVGSSVPEWMQRPVAETTWRGFTYNIWNDSPRS